MVAVLTFVCLVRLIKGITHVPVTMGHNLIKMGTTALVRQYSLRVNACKKWALYTSMIQIKFI